MKAKNPNTQRILSRLKKIIAPFSPNSETVPFGTMSGVHNSFLGVMPENLTCTSQDSLSEDCPVGDSLGCPMHPEIPKELSQDGEKVNA